MIDWSDATCAITPHFTVKDALFLHAWNRLAAPDDGYKADNLVTLCVLLEHLRDLLDDPIIIHSMFRSIAYNRDQNINPVNDVHSQSIAADFTCPNLSVEAVKAKLRPELDRLKIRLEKGTTTWVHIDMRKPGPSGREFTA